MQPSEQIIQLSDHIKTKLQQSRKPIQHLSKVPIPFKSNETTRSGYIDIDDNDNESLFSSYSDNSNFQRQNTFTIDDRRKSSNFIFTNKIMQRNVNISPKEKQCQQCIYRDEIIYNEQQRFRRLYEENKNLHKELLSSVLRYHQYEDNIRKLKSQLSEMSSLLYEYQINFDKLKQNIILDKKTNSNIDQEKYLEVEENQQDKINDHIKRLRYEIQMYNRLVAAKQQQEEGN